MGSETVIQRICYINSCGLLYKFLWIISEGLCDIILKGTVYLHSLFQIFSFFYYFFIFFFLIYLFIYLFIFIFFF